MNKALKITLIIVGSLVIAGALIFTGVCIGRQTTHAWVRQDGSEIEENDRTPAEGSPFNKPGRGMGNHNAEPFSGGGPGMRRMGGYGASDVEPLTVDVAYQAAETFLSRLDIQGLKIAEVMVFNNNAYVRVVEESTGIGAFELLVDPVTVVAFPEPGANLMWNLKYGALNHQEMMDSHGGMMDPIFSDAIPADVTADMNVTAEQALQAAQQFLDKAQPGLTAGPDADAFYGYYTMDILHDGKPVGMLSVNGFNSQVLVHRWHGTFIEEKDY